MIKSNPAEIAAFAQWRDETSPAGQRGIVRQYAEVVEPPMSDEAPTFKTMTACGKALGECARPDLLLLAKWHAALGKEHKRRLAALKAHAAAKALVSS